MRDRAVTCCFTGNRPEKLPWGTNENALECIRFKESLRDTLAVLLREGYRHFITGMARGGDLMFAEAVLELNGVTLEAAVPFPGQPDGWNAADRARYERILKRCDVVTRVSDAYTRYCMFKRNEYMVDCASAVISLLRGPGGTARTVEYARKKGVRVIAL